MNKPINIDQYFKRRRNISDHSQLTGYFIGQKESTNNNWEKVVGTNYIYISDNKISAAKLKYDSNINVFNVALMDPNDQGSGIYTIENTEFALIGLMIRTEPTTENNKLPETVIELFSKPVNSWIDYIALKSSLGEEISIEKSYQENKSVSDKMVIISPNILLARNNDNFSAYDEIEWEGKVYPVIQSLVNNNYVVCKCPVPALAPVTNRWRNESLNEQAWFLTSLDKSSLLSSMKKKYGWSNNLDLYPVKILKDISKNTLGLEKVGERFPLVGSCIFNHETGKDILLGFSEKFKAGKGNEILNIKNINNELD